MMEEIVTVLKDLIRFKTMHAFPEEILQCAGYIEDFFKENRIDHQRFDINGYPSILVAPKSGYVPVLLMAHIDVVDGADDLFEPKEKDGKLYGRGTIDDKYAVAVSMVLLKHHAKALREKGKSQDDLPFGVLFTSDEEIGGHSGAGKMMDKVKTDFCIALDGGSPSKIVVKEKGILSIRMISKGKAAHGSRPWLGENAVDNLIDDYMKLKSLFETPGPDTWFKTMNLGLINAGKSFNQVPDRAEAVFDIRYTENDDPDRIFTAMKETVDSELVIERKEPMFFGGESSYLDRLLKVAVTAETGFEHGASDARYFSNSGTNGIVWGADGDNSAHAVDEHIHLKSLFDLYRVLDTYLTRLASDGDG